MDSYFKGLWCLTKQSMRLFKSQKSWKKWHSIKVSWVALLATTPLIEILSNSPPFLRRPCHFEPPTPTVLSVVVFLYLSGQSRHIWCAILLDDNMDLHMSSLGNIVPKEPWCLFQCNKASSWCVFFSKIINL